ncbi:Yip1-domain-containing protein [Guyanagaster necrorhizus]|uniref:Protein YIP n=1 Tax=Guyanagaster necrorhizus TaxID=856835 RepID=A0A9P7W5B1_9AGAR|nr:Yip1-domain-containing protein [Guyanagaster necrorhizus MCA 3950]KAG7451571.1 Yip1-domain-containing protein [Guyanagaster necrorhizus MCA 3950]
MAYVAVEADERLEEGPEGLQFKSFLGSNANDGSDNVGTGRGVGNTDRGYLQDRPHQTKDGGGGGFWTTEYYQPYFDVDTKMVLTRCYSTLLPTSTDYLSTHLNPADLYGPFWTLTTLIFALFLSSSLDASIAAYLSAPGAEYDYDFQLLSIAVSIVYAYGLGLPVLLWIALRYLGVGEWNVVEAVAIWGYAMFVWIPVSVLCVIPVPILRWVLVAVAFVQSGYFLVRNVYPILASAEAKATRLIIIAITVLHAGLALSFKVLFFSYYVIDKIGADIPLPGGDEP